MYVVVYIANYVPVYIHISVQYTKHDTGFLDFEASDPSALCENISLSKRAPLSEI